ncbi:MAG: glutathione S-transferase [bacterium]|nr:glutathione S-transferase [bacterium]
MSPPITLYAFVTSPFAAKVKCYLDYKQLPFAMEYVDPIGAGEVAFTNQRRIPVLKIGEEWRRDSSEIGLWLEERFPERPILGESPAERARILELDEWVTASLIPAIFRQAVEWDSTRNGWHNGWRLSAALHATRPLPFAARWLWPLLVRRAAFIHRIVNRQQKRYGKESRGEMWNRIFQEFAERLGQGPFLGEQPRPSLADLSAYPQFVFPRLLGMRFRGDAEIRPPLVLARWLARMKKELPENPSLIPDRMLNLPDAAART